MMLDDTAPSADATAEILRLCTDWWWRITSGVIYKIKAKSSSDDPDSPGMAVPFIPNAAQMLLLKNLHNRNIVLKARQMGFSSLIDILALDHALFNSDQNVTIIAHNEAAAEELFRDKIKYAYDRLPETLRGIFRLSKETQSALIFEHNNSAIRVLTSARSGTTHFLHVSEMGKIAAKFPEKARELTTGSLQSVPPDGYCFIESTSEGQGGAFYELASLAQAKRQAQKILSPQDYRFHFFPWFIDPTYELDPKSVIITLKDHAYFDDVEIETGLSISMRKRAFYVSKRDNEFSHEPTLMWREYPSTEDECWKSGTEGKYLHHVLAKARAEGRIGRIIHRPGMPVNSFWDIGASDTTVCWLHQFVAGNDHWIGYRAANGEGFLPFILWMETLGYVWGAHYMPHDASNLQKNIEAPTSILSQLRALRPTWNFQVVPRVSTIQHGIDLLRTDFATYFFDEESCKDGLKHLGNYKQKWSNTLQCYTNEPEHNDDSHPTDALRQKAQAFASGNNNTKPLRPRVGAARSGLTA